MIAQGQLWVFPDGRSILGAQGEETFFSGSELPLPPER